MEHHVLLRLPRSVKMRLVVRSRGPEQETLLRENESARVERGADDPGFRVVRFAADPAAFVRAGQFPMG